MNLSASELLGSLCALCVCLDYRPLDLVVYPVPQPPQRLRFTQQTPPQSPLYQASSSLQSRSQQKGSRQSSPRASEFRILETPFVVKVSSQYPHSQGSWEALTLQVEERSCF